MMHGSMNIKDKTVFTIFPNCLNNEAEYRTNSICITNYCYGAESFFTSLQFLT